MYYSFILRCHEKHARRRELLKIGLPPLLSSSDESLEYGPEEGKPAKSRERELILHV